MHNMMILHQPMKKKIGIPEWTVPVVCKRNSRRRLDIAGLDDYILAQIYCLSLTRRDERASCDDVAGLSTGRRSGDGQRAPQSSPILPSVSSHKGSYMSQFIEPLL